MKKNKVRGKIVLHDDRALVTLYEGGGKVLVDKPLSYQTVATLFADSAFDSGVLPARCVYYRNRGDGNEIGVFQPAHRATVATEKRTYDIPLPPMIWAGKNHRYSLFALRGDELDPQGWPRPDTRLYLPPLSNIFNNGSVCGGNNTFPLAGRETIWTAWDQFFASLFTQHLVGNRARRGGHIMALWKKIEQLERFPDGELVALMLIEGPGTVAGLAGTG